jgi:hypothetical protein
MKKAIFFLLFSLFSLSAHIHANVTVDNVPSRQVSIIGGGIIGALESYSAYQDAQKNETKICITVYEKGESFATSTPSEHGNASTNTSYNIVPSLTIDEILSVVPRGSEMVKKLAIPFSNPGGIRIDDVDGVNDSVAATNFKEAVALYGLDKNHEDRTQTLLKLGKMSMDLWQDMYDHADEELKGILEASNFNPCREPRNEKMNSLHDGYRIDLIYGIPNAEMRALSMQADYEQLGYKSCKILSPHEAAAIDPYLADFCKDHSELDGTANRNWKNDSVALWRPGGCIDTQVFLPKFYNYIKKVMGQYKSASGKIEDCFSLKFSSEVTAAEFDNHSDNLRIIGLKFSNGSQQLDNPQFMDSRYVFCPGEAVGTLNKLGFNEPAYAGFAGPSLLLNIPILPEQLQIYKNFSHCMEVHNEGIVLAWQARVKENNIFIGVAGTKAFYGDQLPNKNEAFAKNRNLVQLNMINNVLPEFISLALGYNTQGKELSPDDLRTLEEQGILQRWVGRRSVAYDGFPTFGYLYCNNRVVSNARCTTHLGSGGVSFAPAAVLVSRSSEQNTDNVFIKKILMYADSRRTAITILHL